MIRSLEETVTLCNTCRVQEKTDDMHRNLKSRELRIQVRGGLLEHNSSWLDLLLRDLLLIQSTGGITGESTAGSTAGTTSESTVVHSLADTQLYYGIRVVLGMCILEYVLKIS